MHQKDIKIFAYINILDIAPKDDVDNRLLGIVKLRSRSRSQVRTRSGPGQVPGQVQKVQGLRTKDLDLG